MGSKMALHITLTVVSTCLFAADVGAMRATDHPSRAPQSVTTTLWTDKGPATGQTEVVIQRSDVFPLLFEIIALIFIINRYLFPALKFRISAILHQRKHYQVEQVASSVGEVTQQAARHPRTIKLESPSALAAERLKHRCNELSTEVSRHRDWINKQVKAHAALIHKLTRQGVFRDARDETTTARYAEHCKILESQIADQQTRVNKDRARIDALYSTIREIEGKVPANFKTETSTSHSADLMAKLIKLESLNSQLEKRHNEVRQEQTLSRKRLDELELRSRLNASIVNDLKQKVGPGFKNVETDLAVLNSRLMKALDQQHKALQDAITQERRYINAQISILQKQLAEAAKGTNDPPQPAKANANSASYQVSGTEPNNVSLDLTAIHLGKYTQKLNEMVATSERKFDEHAARILDLESAVFKPAGDVLPTEERLINLEYDVQKLKGEERGGVDGGRDVTARVDALQVKLEKLRNDVKTAFGKAVTLGAHRRALREQEASKQQVSIRLDAVEREQAHLDYQTKSFETRLKTVLRDCDSLWIKIQELSSMKPSRLAEVEGFLKKANESFSVGLVQISQQVELLNAGFATLREGLLARVAECEATVAAGEVTSLYTSVPNTACSTSAWPEYRSNVDLRSSSSSFSRLPRGSSGLDAVENYGSALQPQSTLTSHSRTWGYIPHDHGNAAKGSRPVETAFQKRYWSFITSSLPPDACASTSPFGAMRADRPSANSEDQANCLNDPIRTLEQKATDLPELYRPSTLALAVVPHPAECSEEDLAHSTEARLLPSPSNTRRTTLSPFLQFHPVDDPTRSACQAIARSSGPPAPFAHPSEPEGSASRSLIDQHVRQNPPTSATPLSIWQISSQEGSLAKVSSDLQHLKEEVNDRLSHLEQSEFYASCPTGFDRVNCTLSPAHSRHYWNATLADLDAKVNQVQVDLGRFDASIRQESANLSAFRGEIQIRWQRELSSLPSATAFHELKATYWALTNRINSLEYQLRNRRLI